MMSRTRRRRYNTASDKETMEQLDQGHDDKKSVPSPSILSVPVAVALWYLLGVISISTSKILLSSPYESTPLLLSVQQFALGATLLKIVMKFGPVGDTSCSGTGAESLVEVKSSIQKKISYCGLFFGLGFVATNYCFYASAASFVETVKAAEPLTSAGTAYLWGIETLTPPEGISLLVIVSGVLLSTFGNSGSLHGSGSVPVISDLSASFKSCLLVMVANICFSFRGLHQRLLRQSPEGGKEVIGDVVLQYQMQRMSVLIFTIPAVLLEFPEFVATALSFFNVMDHGVDVRYVAIVLINGFVFTSYNLASTYVLSRVSLIHHAALNCIRRVFAIVVTSIVFRNPITLLSACGIGVSVLGFMAFTNFKLKRIRRKKNYHPLLPVKL